MTEPARKTRIRRPNLGRCVLLICAALLIVGFGIFQGDMAFAHASVVRAEPSPDSILSQPPGRVSLWFTEPIEPGFSEIQVRDNQGRRVDNRNSVVDPRDPKALSVTLPTLPEGTYTVAWQNVSAVDGHAVRDSYVFSIGEAPTPSEPLSPGSRVEAPEQPLFGSPVEPVLRWLGLLGVLAAVGGLGFELLVTRPVLARRNTNKTMRRLCVRLEDRMLKVIWVGMGLFLLASAGQLLVQTSVVYDIPLYKTLGSPLTSILKDTAWGHLWLWRMGLLLTMAAVLGGARTALLRRQGSSKLLPLFIRVGALALGGAVLLTMSLGSHGAATGQIRTAAVFSDYLHLLAAGFWVGGLFHFALGVPLVIRILDAKERRAALSALVPRFSALATLSVGTLIITGIYSSWAQVTTLSALATPYGLTLLSKIGLVVPLLLLAALNRLWVRPRLANEEKAGRWLRRLISGEAILAVLVLASVGLLTSLEPARQVASRQITVQENSLVFHDVAEGMHIYLQIKPGQVGLNRAEVSLADLRGSPVDNASDVSIRLRYLNAELGENPASATPAGQGRYVLNRAYLSIAGPWSVEMVVRRPDAFDTRAAFRFEVAPAPNVSSAAIAPSPRMGKLLWGVEMVLLGFLFLGVGDIPLEGWRNRVGAGIMAIGAAGILVGLFLVLTA
ncbi:MAG: copper resistance protein CopC/CopD [Chloroflexi bacterium]|nr:copper resistance protein CopC/CopD [Chloroflexota bacterium]